MAYFWKMATPKEILGTKSPSFLPVLMLLNVFVLVPDWAIFLLLSLVYRELRHANEMVQVDEEYYILFHLYTI